MQNSKQVMVQVAVEAFVETLKDAAAVKAKGDSIDTHKPVMKEKVTAVGVALSFVGAQGTLQAFIKDCINTYMKAVTYAHERKELLEYVLG